ncbi:MAG TPA: uroporphyrinogen decarboxylase [Acidobacteriota bacterium]|jgi:uroporphyrinogen decarboxylase
MDNDRFLRACRREATESVPVWFMRQAGRYLPEYRAIRESHTILEICSHPELACQVTLQPLRRFDLDAAILFADLLLPLKPMGLDFDFQQGEGPVIFNPVASAQDVERLRSFDPQMELAAVLETIRLVVRELNGRVPLIGFAGAPFTLASYMIEGGASRSFERTKLFMYESPPAWHRLMDFLVRHQAAFLRAQIEAGASAVQVFDSWLGTLGPDDFRTFVQPHSSALLREVASAGVPVVHFATGIGGYLEEFSNCGGDVISLDWRVDLARARRILRDRAVQGNLDPVCLLGPLQGALLQAQKVLQQAGSGPGYIFNLGHGILPATPVESVQAIVELVHSQKSKG